MHTNLLTTSNICNIYTSLVLAHGFAQFTVFFASYWFKKHHFLSDSELSFYLAIRGAIVNFQSHLILWVTFIQDLIKNILTINLSFFSKERKLSHIKVGEIFLLCSHSTKLFEQVLTLILLLLLLESSLQLFKILLHLIKSNFDILLGSYPRSFIGSTWLSVIRDCKSLIILRWYRKKLWWPWYHGQVHLDISPINLTQLKIFIFIFNLILMFVAFYNTKVIGWCLNSNLLTFEKIITYHRIKLH